MKEGQAVNSLVLWLERAQWTLCLHTRLYNVMYPEETSRGRIPGTYSNDKIIRSHHSTKYEGG